MLDDQVVSNVRLGSNFKYSQLFSLSEILSAIKEINTGIGIDGVHSNHLKYLPLNAFKSLLKFYKSCLIHNHLPVVMLEGYIKPSVKDVKGDITCSDNHHEIMISNNMFKILNDHKNFINLSPYQFRY